MSENWNLEIVADSKSEVPPEKPSAEAAPAIPSVLSSDHSLGAIMTIAREARGFSREQAAKASNIPTYYLTMIETDDYSSIADQLYLLPFLRRYATFVNLEPEEVASRFIRDVQRADMNPGRPSEPIAMFEPRKPFPWRIVIGIGMAAVAAAGGWLGYRHFIARKSPVTTSKPSTVPESEEEQPAPKAADAAPAPMALPSVAIVPAPEPSVAAAPVAAAPSAVAPAAIASSAAVSPLLAHSAAPLGASTPKSSGHASGPGSSSSRSSGGHPRPSIRSSSNSHRLSVQN